MTQSEHRRPLAPGEIRTHVVGDTAFQVMHVANGSFTQASYRDGVDGPTVVLKTDRFESVAVAAYAAAIQIAERIESDPAIKAAEAAEQAESDALSYNLPMGADMALVTGERSTTGLGPAATVRPEDGTPDVEAGGNAGDDPAELLQDLRAIWARQRPGMHRDNLLARIDRIIATVGRQAPQRATDCDGDALWQHVCGAVLASTGKDRPPYSCGAFNCFEQSDPSTWRALYVIEDAR